VALGEYYQHHTWARLNLSTLIPSHSLSKGLVMCTMGPLTVQGFASDVCGPTLVAQRRLLKCAIEVTICHVRRR